ncbi:SAM domain (Sterile alpha motif) domain containing protein [Acanthamoeba castellanii str. Neff]|uniref:SAM domain (Sterile alpha motif) domain containing protein n=1 Tax=Acanthamoeba castellanii (strain ATCC 30010 / Neff) TaxID=1257118 RepID=L8H2A8_ACACF|nr:SAM domain (Sterile alpha motif) domain containing protein [Acanthamoeba castellanii str. Neff]ELR19372.1 SAM domain (Sterile alpha motif) domain containing protein [Acanthamoeba castellanii str. Neff]
MMNEPSSVVGDEQPAAPNQQQGMFAKFARKNLAKTKSAPDLVGKKNAIQAPSQQKKDERDDKKVKQMTANSIAQLEAELRRENEKLERLVERKKKRRSLKEKEVRGDLLPPLQDDDAATKKKKEDGGNGSLERMEEEDKKKRRSKKRASGESSGKSSSGAAHYISNLISSSKERKKEKREKKKERKDEKKAEKQRKKREKRSSSSSLGTPAANNNSTNVPKPSSYSLNSIQATKILRDANIDPATTARGTSFSTSTSTSLGGGGGAPPLAFGSGSSNSVRFRDPSSPLGSAKSTSAAAMPLSARAPPTNKTESGAAGAATSRGHRATMAPGVPLVLGGAGAADQLNQVDGDYMKKMARHELQAYQQSQGDETVLRRAIRNKYLLHVSVEAGHDDVVRFLVNNKKLKLNTPDAMGWTPLHCACAAGHVNIILFLLSKKRTNVQKVTSDGCTALHYLIRHFPDPFAPDYNELLEKYSDVANRLVSIGCDVNATNRNGETVLHYAAFRGKSTAVRYLLAHRDWDLDINATTNGSLDTVNALLESRAATNIVGINGTPLDIAKRQNDKRLVMALLKHKQKKEPSNYRMNRDDAQYLGYAYSSAGEDGDMDETTEAEFISDVEPEDSSRHRHRRNVLARTPTRDHTEREEEEELFFGSNKAVVVGHRQQQHHQHQNGSPMRPVAAFSSPWRRSLVLLESEKVAERTSRGQPTSTQSPSTREGNATRANRSYRASMHVSSPIRSLTSEWDLDPSPNAITSVSTEDRRLAKRKLSREERKQRRKSGGASRRQRSVSLNKQQQEKKRNDLRAQRSFSPRKDSSDDLSSPAEVEGKGKEKVDDYDHDHDHNNDVDVDKARAAAAAILKRRGNRAAGEQQFDMKPRWEEEQEQEEAQEDNDHDDKSSSSGTEEKQRQARERMRSREREIRKEDDEGQHNGSGERVIHVLDHTTASEDDRKTTTADDDDDDDDDSDGSDADNAKNNKKRSEANMRRVISFDDELARKKKNLLNKSAQSVTLDYAGGEAGKPSTKAKRAKKKRGGGKSEGEGGSRTKRAKKEKKKGSSTRTRSKKKENDDGEADKEKTSSATRKTNKQKKTGAKKGADDEKKIKAWLNELNLPAEYLRLFQQDGFDDMNTIQLITEEELADIGISKTGHRKRIMRWVKQNPASPVYSPRSARSSIAGDGLGSSEFYLTDPAEAARMMAAAAAAAGSGSASSIPATGGTMGSRLSSFTFSPYSPFAFIKARSAGAGGTGLADLNSPHSISIDSPKEERRKQQQQIQLQLKQQFNSPHSISIESPQEERARKLKLRSLQRNSLAAPLAATGRGSAFSTSSPLLSARGSKAADGDSAGPSLPPVRRKNRWVSGEETTTRPLSPLLRTQLDLEETQRREEEEERERRLYTTSPMASPRKVTIAATPAMMATSARRPEPHQIYVKNNIAPTSGSPLSPRKHQITAIPIPTTAASSGGSSSNHFLARTFSTSPSSSSSSSSSSSPSPSSSPTSFCTPSSPRLPAFTRKPLPRPPASTSTRS